MRRDSATTHHKTKIRRRAAATRQFQELTVPYYFSSITRQRGDDIRIGDYVAISGLDKKFELIDIIWQYGSVRVREVGGIEGYVFPWGNIRPWQSKDETSKTPLMAIYNWIFRGTRVYRLSEPDRVLTTVRINWDAQSTDLQDADGTVFRDIPWTDVEFLHPEDYHLAGDD